MDDSLYRILFLFTDLIMPMTAGYILYQKKIISDRLCSKLITINICFIYTLLAALSFWSIPLSWSLITLPILGCLLVLVPGVIGFFTFAERYHSPRSRGAWYMSAMMTNLSTLGGLCAFIIYGPDGFAYTQLIGTFQLVMVILVCFPLAAIFQQYAENRSKAARRPPLLPMLLTRNQLPILGMFLGLLLNVLGIERPTFFSSLFSSFVHIGAWFGLLPVGCLVNFDHVKPYLVRTLDLIPLHFVIIPIIFYVPSLFLFDDPVIQGVILLEAAAPTAINAVVTSRLFRLTVDLSVASFLSTTVIYILVFFPVLFALVHLL
ncbi:hypothetical protein TAMA11512_02610 [Selenomonas sp. TAMA-11512]|uniref:AEC family transporter n=1 Tax=Selenomonas sp. TAMA-11512 TaxID=3095337 RepID=UPI003086EC2B|nr:hypothetical protein TAMA11512_02610 [Selenomonas sp. TAMA-11512]